MSDDHSKSRAKHEDPGLRILRGLRGHIGLVSTSGVVIFATMRAIAESRANTNTLSVYVASADVATVLSTVVLELLPLAAIFSLGVMLYSWIHHELGGLRLLIAIAIIGFVLASTGPAFYFVLAALFFVFPAVISRVRGRNPIEPDEPRLTGRPLQVGVLLGLLAVVSVGIQGQPWLATEVVQVSGAEPRVAHVVLSSGWAHLIDASDRSLNTVPADDIVSRTACEPVGEYQGLKQPIVVLVGLLDGPHHPRCEDVLMMTAKGKI